MQTNVLTLKILPCRLP